MKVLVVKGSVTLGTKSVDVAPTKPVKDYKYL